VVSRGEPDYEFDIELIVTLPNTDLWNRYRDSAERSLKNFMFEAERLPEKDIFPWVVVSDALNHIPPAPSPYVCSNLYRRVLSCMEINTHPGSKERGSKVYWRRLPQ
jgi:hypothetical protein